MALSAKNKKDSDDWTLIELALKGDEKAYALLFGRYRQSVYTTIYQMVRNVELAEDLTMEVFAKAFKSLDHYQPTNTFISWLTTVAKNHTYDFLRKKQPDNISIDESLESRPGRAILQVEEPDPDPEEEMLASELNNSIHVLVNLLKPRYRRLIELRYFEELSYEEIGKELSLPLGTVKAQLFRAKDLLNQILKNKKDQL
ncbi:MAG: sigma-70 family RNA polymerase sigma factor [Bacteroidota bacterium]